MTHNVLTATQAVGTTGEVVDGAAQEDAVPDLLLARQIGVARKTWLRVRRVKEQLAEWIESLRLPPVPVRI